MRNPINYAKNLLFPLVLFGTLAHAHDYWFEGNGNTLQLMRGHHDFSAHEGTKVVPYDPAIVTAATCRVAGKDSPLPRPSGPYPVSVKADCDNLLIEVDSGIWSQTMTGTKNESPKKLFGVLKSWHSLETVKLMKSWNPNDQKPLGQGLELISTKDPFATKTGGKLRLQALLNGKPAAGVAVAYDGRPRGVTGSDGKISIKVRHAGQQMLTASLEKPLSNGVADKQIQSTALIFTLK